MRTTLTSSDPTWPDLTMAEHSQRTCTKVNARGERCGTAFGLDATGACAVHREGGSERMREVSVKGGQATKAAWAAEGFTLAELPRLTDIESAMAALDTVRQAAMTRRLTHAEANAASKSLAEWIKGHAVLQTQRIVTELQRELDAKGDEIEQLRKQLARPQRVS